MPDTRSIAIAFANAGPLAHPEAAAALGELSDEFGIESLWTVEHVVIPDGYQSQYPYSSSGRAPGAEHADIPDPLVWLAYVAARTTKVKLATGILILPQRNLLVVGKEIATLDQLSQGRVLLGVGAGWLEEEFDALGVPFADRGARLDDHLRGLRALWSDRVATYHGTHSSFDGLISLPHPASGAVPIHVGGHTKRAARRAGELGDGFFPGKGSPEELAALVAEVRRAADGAGRDPDRIELTTAWRPDAGERAALADLGFTRFVVMPPAFSADEMRAGFERLADEVLAAP